MKVSLELSFSSIFIRSGGQTCPLTVLAVDDSVVCETAILTLFNRFKSLNIHLLAVLNDDLQNLLDADPLHLIDVHHLDY